MAFMDSADGSQMGSEGPDSNDTPPADQEENRGRGMPPEPHGGPILAALQRQARGPQASAPGPGNTADSLGKLKIAIDLMQMSLNGFEAGSAQYKDVLNALKALTRHLPETGPQAGLEQTHLIDLLRRGRQNPLLQAISGLFGGGGQSGSPGGGQGPQPPMPSTPLPGA